jgi:hypothetical protein
VKATLRENGEGKRRATEGRDKQTKSEII